MLAAEFPDAAVLRVPSPDPSDLGSGRQWFSVRGITEESRPQRIASAMPLFIKTVRDLQARTDTQASQTALVGFSQGATMALESTQSGDPLAATVVAMSGRFSNTPIHAPRSTSVHFLHSEADSVISFAYTQDAAATLARLGVAVTVDALAGLGHRIDDRAASACSVDYASPLPDCDRCCRRAWELRRSRMSTNTTKVRALCRDQNTLNTFSPRARYLQPPERATREGRQTAHGRTRLVGLELDRILWCESGL